jgi:hypothetical protein
VTRLIVVPASEVGDRPRWWTRKATVKDALVSEGGGVFTEDEMIAECLHLKTIEAGAGENDDGRWNALVAAPDAQPTPTTDPTERDFWCALARDLLPIAQASVTVYPSETAEEHATRVAELVAIVADAMTAEYRKRWAVRT